MKGLKIDPPDWKELAFLEKRTTWKQNRMDGELVTRKMDEKAFFNNAVRQKYGDFKGGLKTLEVPE